MGQTPGGKVIEAIQDIRADMDRITEQFEKRVVGNRLILYGILKALLSGGHVLMEGTPGLGKTLMVKTVAEILDLDFARIQFTPDLMPADIIGTNIIFEEDVGKRRYRFEKGPVFTQVLLADEINRASPKTQSALLESMEEHRVTVFGTTYPMDDPFFTLATQNPIEMAGTYPLPEAQLDRFFFKLLVDHPESDALLAIARLNAEPHGGSAPVKKILSRDRIMEIRQILATIPITSRVYDFAVELIQRTHPGYGASPAIAKRFVKYGASPRGVNAVLAAARVTAVMDGRVNLAIDDIEANFLPALRHRLVMKFESEMEGVGAETVLNEIFADLTKNF